MDNRQRLKVLFETYEHMLGLEQFWDWSTHQFSKRLGVAQSTIYNWSKRIDWDGILAARRQNYKEKTAQVDLALFKMALRDKGSAELWYERFDGYVPTRKVIGQSETNDELRRRADKIKAELLAGEGLGQNSLGAGEATA